jgi:hypothetical protein
MCKAIHKVAVAGIAPIGGQETVRMVKEAGSEAVFVEVDVYRATDKVYHTSDAWPGWRRHHQHRLY